MAALRCGKAVQCKCTASLMQCTASVVETFEYIWKEMTAISHYTNQSICVTECLEICKAVLLACYLLICLYAIDLIFNANIAISGFVEVFTFRQGKCAGLRPGCRHVCSEISDLSHTAVCINFKYMLNCF